MPVKIVANTGDTSITTGQIRKADLTDMINDFRYETSLLPSAPRSNVTKNIAFYFTKQQFLDLFKDYETVESKVVKVIVGIQIPGSVESPCSTDLSDGMGVIIEMVNNKSNLTAKDAVGDSILINGYHNYDAGKTVNLTDDGCCPSIGN